MKNYHSQALQARHSQVVAAAIAGALEKVVLRQIAAQVVLASIETLQNVISMCPLLAVNMKSLTLGHSWRA